MKVAVGLRRVAAGKRTSGRRAAQIALRIASFARLVNHQYFLSFFLGFKQPNIKVQKAPVR